MKEKKTKIKFMEGDEIFDWWTKYYASFSEMKESYENTNMTDDKDQNHEMTFEREDLFLTPDDIESNAARQKKSDFTDYTIKSLKMLARMLIFIGVMRKTQTDPKLRESNLLAPTKRRNQLKPATFIIYSNELEKQPEYYGFQDWMDSFDIYHGKKHQGEDMQRMIKGKFKGLIQLQKINENGKNKDLNEDATNNDVTKSSTDRDYADSKQQTLPVHSAISFTNQSLRVWVRVYVIRAYSLTPKDISGYSDPYVVVFVGDNKTKSEFWKTMKKHSPQVSGKRSEYVPRNLNPLFGRCFEVEALLPRDNTLTICLMDWDAYSQDDFIGKTEIDIENRLYSKHRATCGISSSFELSGYNKWRDKQKPSVILSNLCKHFNIDDPTYRANEVIVGQKSISLLHKSKKRKQRKREYLALTALKQWPEVATANGLPAWSLVPEHIETRSLYDPKQIGIEQGKVEMWVDMFYIPDDIHDSDSIQEYLGPPVDISPRKPTPYELRVIIWNTEDVELCDTNIITGEKSSDIFVKGWLYGPRIDYQCTDVHRKSFSGEGSFNWRFIFPFLYISAERSLVIQDANKINFGKRLTKFLKSLIRISTGFESRECIPCLLQLEVWDEDHFSPDDFIGAITLHIDNIPIGSKNAATCNAMILRDHPRINLFKTHQIRGWWPVGRRVKKRKNEDSFKMTASQYFANVLNNAS
ncbi:hypothetical protein J437_LFUL000165 [Ladona fulva]|uniref:C2 domain-containing protein n=1 Tax=Ladona fulva TaxID=123851 RepID=A0A8K0KFL9_LADFU|nr:hypothetical protein J437_LFUL000165 [Ladona fulva]